MSVILTCSHISSQNCIISDLQQFKNMKCWINISKESQVFGRLFSKTIFSFIVSLSHLHSRYPCAYGQTFAMGELSV